MPIEQVVRSSCHPTNPDGVPRADTVAPGERVLEQRTWHYPISWEAPATPDALLVMATQVAAGLGFRYVAHMLNSSLPLSSPQCLSVDNLPDDCRDGGITSALDPLLRSCRATLRPLVWDNTVFERVSPFRAALQGAGVGSGWSQVVRDSQGRWGMFTAFRGGPALTADELWKVEPRLVWLAQVFHHHLSSVCELRYASKADVKLTETEKTILRWTVDGKTSSELAEILDLSTRTVNFHVQNILAKMNTCNKTSAAAQAAILGLLN